LSVELLASKATARSAGTDTVPSVMVAFAAMSATGGVVSATRMSGSVVA
jgi:hypothetical protein